MVQVVFMLDGLRRQVREETSGAALPLIAFGIALNLTAGQITALLKIPVYLDSIGTVLVAVLCGPWAGIIAGCLSNAMAAALGNPTMIFFIPPMIAIGAFTGVIARNGWFRKTYLCLAGGILQGLIAASLSAPISAYLFSGATMGGADFLVLFFRSKGLSILQSTLLQGLVMDPIDKTITYFIVLLLIRNIPLRLLARFPNAANISSAPV